MSQEDDTTTILTSNKDYESHRTSHDSTSSVDNDREEDEEEVKILIDESSGRHVDLDFKKDDLSKSYNLSGFSKRSRSKRSVSIYTGIRSIKEKEIDRSRLDINKAQIAEKRKEREIRRLNDSRLKRLTDDELEKVIVELEDHSRILNIESEMFSTYMLRLTSMSDYQMKVQKQDVQPYGKMAGIIRRMTTHKTGGVGAVGVQKSLSMRHKIDAVKGELEALKQIITRETNLSKQIIKEASFGVIDLNRQLAVLKEKKSAFDDIFDSSTALLGAVKPKNMNIIKFWQEEVHKAETDVLKLRLKKVALQLHLAKMQSLTNQAEETNEILSENDIHLLKIKNHILHKRIKEGNENLLVLKVTAGKMRLKLNSLKTSLGEAEKISSLVDTKIFMASDQAEKSNSEIKHVNKSLGKIKEQNKHILGYINAYTVPEVIEYAKFVENLQPLERQIKHFSRKIEVKKTEIKKMEKTMKDRVNERQMFSMRKCWYDPHKWGPPKNQK